VHLRIAGEKKILYKARVQPLGRDAVAIKDNSISFMQRQLLAMTLHYTRHE
jgi:hypothetical protein